MRSSVEIPRLLENTSLIFGNVGKCRPLSTLNSIQSPQQIAIVLIVVEGVNVVSDHLVNCPSLLTVKAFCEKHSAFSEGGMRYLIFQSQDRHEANGKIVSGNGLDQAGAIVRVGRRVLIDEQAFFRWVAGQNRLARVSGS